MLYAAFYGRLKLMKCLNLRGWQINGYDYDGRTALGLACSEEPFRRSEVSYSSWS